jgi:hypothetical protein
MSWDGLFVTDMTSTQNILTPSGYSHWCQELDASLSGFEVQVVRLNNDL